MTHPAPPKLGFLGRYGPQDTVSPGELEEGLKWMLLNGIAGKVMNTLVVGAFLTAFALHLGASNAMIGVLAAIPQLGNLGQLLGIYLIERTRVRRRICIGFGFLVRPMFVVIAAAALIPDPGWALGAIVVALAVRYLFGAVILCSWNSWMRDLLPDERRAGFLARNLRWMTFFGMLVSLGAAAFIDYWDEWTEAPTEYAYASIFLLAAFVGFYNTYTVTRIPEPRLPAPKGRMDLIKILKQPFANTNFRRVMMFLGSWNFAINLATPFFTVHMLKRLELDLTLVIAFAVISQSANILVLRRWGRIIEQFSNKSVLSVCAPMFLLCILAWTLTTVPDHLGGTIAILVAIHVLTGVATAGVAVASSNLTMKLAPRGEATAYLSANSLVNSMAAGIAPVIGGLLADFFLSSRFSLTVNWESPATHVSFETLRIEQWDFFFILAAVIGLYSIHRLSLVEEEGHVQEKVVIGEFIQSARDSLRTLSSVAGLREATDFPFELLRGKDQSRRKGRSKPKRKSGKKAGATAKPRKGG